MVSLNGIGDRLREIRIAKNLSLRQAAERIGVSHTYLSTLERGCNSQTGKRVNPSAKTLALVSEAYGIPVEELLATEIRGELSTDRESEQAIRRLKRLDAEDREVIEYLIKRLGRG
jgi:transcriptional regulator with XRE-family HTH domain